MDKKEKTIFIGYGTGRCGTTSLTKLAGVCIDAVCTHERRPLLPWNFNDDLFHERVRWFSTSSAAVTGDVAYFYLPYLEKFIAVFPNLKVVCLERDRQAVIESFRWKNPRYNARKSEGRPWTKEDAIGWMQRQILTAENIASVIPPGIDFILVDQEQIVDYLPAQYRAVPFLVRDAIYWGPAPDDTTASGWATITATFFCTEALR